MSSFAPLTQVVCWRLKCPSATGINILLTRYQVVHVVESLRVGGAERLVHDLAIARGADCTSVACLDALGPFGESLLQKGCPVELIGKESGILSTLWRMRRYLERRRPDVVHCHNLPAFLYGALGARLAGDIPVVLTKHGIRMPGGLKSRLNRFLLQRSDAIAVSPQSRDILQAWIHPKSPPVRYIANGISTEAFNRLPPREEARRQLDLPPSSFVTGIVSRIMPCKNHLELLDVFVGILAKIPDALLLIAGDGAMLPAVRNRIRELNLDRHALLLGERRDIPLILAALDCFCLPSDTEGMPMTILEAMAAGIPIVATTVGGIPECVEDGRTALLVPPHEPERLAAALLSIAADPERAKQLGTAAKRTFLNRFSVAHTIDAYEQCYREAIQRRSGLEQPVLASSEPRP